MQPIAIVRNRNHHTPLLCFGVLLILGAVLWPTLSPAQGNGTPENKKGSSGNSVGKFRGLIGRKTAPVLGFRHFVGGWDLA